MIPGSYKLLDHSMNIIDKRRVVVHVTFIKIGEINTLKETFDGDVLVRAKWLEPTLDKGQIHTRELNTENIDWSTYWNPKLFIENVVGEPKTTESRQLEYSTLGEATVMQRKRFKGTFLEQMELWEFPFDLQDLTVNVMSDMPAAEINLVEDPEEIHKVFKQSFIDEQEFYLYKYIASERHELQKDKADPFVKRCVLTVKCKAARRPSSFLWNHFAITFLIAILAFLTFSVKPHLVQNRLQLAFTLMLTNVAFKFVITQNLPRISYLTYLDRYVLATMVCLASVCFYHAIQTLLDDDKYPMKDWYALIILGGLYIIYNIQFILRLFLVPFKRRREMLKAEQDYTHMVKEQAMRQYSKRPESANSRPESANSTSPFAV